MVCTFSLTFKLVEKFIKQTYIIQSGMTLKNTENNIKIETKCKFENLHTC